MSGQRYRRLLFFGLALAAVGCGESAPKAQPEQAVLSKDPVELPKLDIESTPAPARTAQVSAAILPLGSIPYDNLSLPLISSDGSLVATQTGAPPKWPTVLAEYGAQPAEATHVEVYSLNYEGGQPRLAATLDEPALLGRTASADGFLIESPQPDGSRWIGLTQWTSGTIEWLVTGGSVNAFAAMSPDNQLAWSQRTIEEGHFRLTVRTHAGEWTLEEEGTDWLLPTWSGRGNNLFVMRLQDGRLSAAFGDATDQRTFQQSLRLLPISEGATVFTAYQAMNASVPQDGSSQSEVLMFYHPVQRCAVAWQPLALKQMTAFAPKSISAVTDADGFALISLPNKLIRQDLSDAARQAGVLNEFVLPRATPAGPAPHVLMVPSEGQVRLAAMQLLPLR